MLLLSLSGSKRLGRFGSINLLGMAGRHMVKMLAVGRSFTNYNGAAAGTQGNRPDDSKGQDRTEHHRYTN